MILPVILCGGSGTRLWPLSRKAYPKQLLALNGAHTMLQNTVLRLSNLPDTLPPIVICNQDHRFVVAEQLREINCANATLILEPVGRNTAPATAIAAIHAANSGLHNPVLLVMPADHQIENQAVFHQAILESIKMAEADYLVTLGITPNRVETGYGYIKKGEALPNSTGYHVAEFVEKPSEEKAAAFIASGHYYWNSGLFLFKAETYLNELQRFEPNMVDVCRRAMALTKKDMDFLRLDDEIFFTCKNQSIDYAIMEKSQHLGLVVLEASGWSDLGSWDALWEAAPKNQDGNAISGDVLTEAVSNSYLHAENRLLTVIGVSDHIVIETQDAVLVAHKKNAQAVKQMVAMLENNNRAEVELHRRVYRPWGYYEIMDNAAHFKVKRLLIKPGASLSLQMHRFRSEHWVVIEGTADVVCGEKSWVLKQNQSIYIPALEKHQLANLGSTNLEIIEVQTGEYLGEDDIIRFEDRYGREIQT